MRDHLMNTGYVEDGEPSNSAEDTPAEWFSPISLLSNTLCCEMRSSRTRSTVHKGTRQLSPR